MKYWEAERVFVCLYACVATLSLERQSAARMMQRVTMIPQYNQLVSMMNKFNNSITVKYATLMPLKRKYIMKSNHEIS
jgi:hypothetical protein